MQKSKITVSNTTRILNRLLNYFASLGVDYRSIAELEVKNAHGNSKLDFLTLVILQSNEYFAFELKYNQKNIQDLTKCSPASLSEMQEMIDRVQKQYQVITNLQPIHWDSLQFPQPLGNINTIYIFINSLFVNEFLSTINFNLTKDSFTPNFTFVDRARIGSNVRHFES